MSINCSSPCMISKLAANDLIEMSKKEEETHKEEEVTEEVTTEVNTKNGDIEVEKEVMETTESLEIVEDEERGKEGEEEETEKEKEEDIIREGKLGNTGPTQEIFSELLNK